MVIELSTHKSIVSFDMRWKFWFKIGNKFQQVWIRCTSISHLVYVSLLCEYCQGSLINILKSMFIIIHSSHMCEFLNPKCSDKR